MDRCVGCVDRSERRFPCDLRLGDCLDVLPIIQDRSVDMVLTDLPYGVLSRSSESSAWDCEIPLEPLWENLLRVAKPRAAIVLFAQGMFTARLMLSQPKLWRYNLVWNKVRASGFLNANRMPLRSHEDICIFYRALPSYTPQREKSGKGKASHSRGRIDKPVTNSCYGRFAISEGGDLSMKHPKSILTFMREPPTAIVHPTQKPVALCRWLVRAYSRPGETVLDATMGCGSTGVACMEEGRRFLGIEKDERYFSVARSRIEKAAGRPRQGELF